MFSKRDNWFVCGTGFRHVFRSAPAALALSLILALLPALAQAELTPEWVQRLPTGTTLYAGLNGMVVDAAGNTYVTGGTGVSYNVDTITAKFAPDGALLWSKVYDGLEEWHDTANGIALGPDGHVYVTGSTPDPNFFANVLLLKYDPDTGELVWARTYDGGPGISDGGMCLAVDREGNVFVGGHTVGDGGDCLTVKFDADGNVIWSRVWDGPAPAPYSQEAVRGIAIDPAGDVVIITDGVMNSLHPDYVVIKYASADGATRWMNNWGQNGGDFPADMAIDADGDIYVTGAALDFRVKYGTVKFAGGNGQILWAEYDAVGFRDSPSALALDGRGGVYVTGSSDPNGDQSKMMHNFFTVKRDAESGVLLWTHQYGATCLRCFDVPGDLIVDDGGHVFVSGSTSSPPFTADQITLALDAAAGVELDRGLVASESSEGASAAFVRLDAAQNVYIGGDYSQYNTGAVDILAVKYPSLGGGVDCDAIAKFKAKCRGGKLTAQVKSTLPEGTALTIDNDGDQKAMIINAQGAGKVKYTGQFGRQTVSIVECEAFVRDANCN